jgi:hypothetical protein
MKILFRLVKDLAYTDHLFEFPVVPQTTECVHFDNEDYEVEHVTYYIDNRNYQVMVTAFKLGN